MAKRDYNGKPEDRSPGEAGLARAYRYAPQEAPAAKLDAAILAAARQALKKPKSRAPFGSQWTVPLSTAAVIVLSLGLLLVLSEQGALNPRGDYQPIPTEVAPPVVQQSNPAQSPAEVSESAQRDALPPKATVESPASSPQDDATRFPVRPIENKKPKPDVPPPAAAPAVRERNVDAPSPVRKEARTRGIGARDANMTHIQADVVAVQAAGQPGAYHFNVGIRSPDLGCKQYADWWEVVSESGALLYRRVLAHSHVNEQPFTRSGGPVSIQPDTIIWIRAHMNTGGYGGTAFKGSVKTGFKQAIPENGFAAGLAQQSPLPDGCNF